MEPISTMAITGAVLLATKGLGAVGENAGKRLWQGVEDRLGKVRNQFLAHRGARGEALLQDASTAAAAQEDGTVMPAEIRTLAAALSEVAEQDDAFLADLRQLAGKPSDRTVTLNGPKAAYFENVHVDGDFHN
jgi:hypothetical protein